MKLFKHIRTTIVLVFCGFATIVWGQNITTVSPNITPAEAVENVLLGAGVTATNITYSGSPFLSDSPQNSVKEFNYSGTTFPMEHGIVLFTQNGASVSSDPDLGAIAGTNNPTNGVVLEFDFVPNGDSLSFQYIFTSAEYSGYTCSSFNDVFGFFISGPGIDGQYSNNSANIAIVPNNPDSIPVGINSVNSGTPSYGNGSFCDSADINWQDNAIYFTTSYNTVYNSSGSGFSSFNGSTVVMTANASVICGETYHIKLAISNVTDQSLNSAVFLQAGSFSSTSTVEIDVSNLTNSVLDSVIVEGCDQGEVCFTRPSEDASDSLITHFNMLGTAVQGTDYAEIAPGDSIIFLPGVTEICLPITPINDGVDEGLENVIISSYSINPCGDTLFTIGEVWIADKPEPLTPDAGPDFVICNAGVDTLQGVLSGPNNAHEWSYDGPGVVTFSPDIYSLNPEITVTTPGEYQFFFTEENDSCFLVETDTVNVVYEVVTMSLSQDTTICQNGIVTLQADALGLGTMDYHWNHTADLQASQTVEPTQEASYIVFAESSYGCPSPSDTVLVSILPAIEVTSSLSQSICPGESATVIADITGGIGQPYIISWTDGSGVEVGNTASVTLTPSATDTYMVTVEDQCESTPDTSYSEIIVGIIPEINMIVPDNEQCEPGTFILVNLTDTTNLLETYWYLSDGQSFVGIDSIHPTVVNPGVYDVDMTIVTDVGCVDSASFNNALIVHQNPKADFSYIPNPVTNLNTKVQFQNGSQGATSYDWNFEQGNPAASGFENPEIEFPEYETGEYIVDLIAYSEFGCTDTIQKIITVFPDVVIFAPNSFTPDNDEHNQYWKVHIDGIDIYNVTIEIFNRWGEMIWESHDLERGWDGTYGGKTVPSGTYIWKIKAKNLVNDNIHQWQGFVNVLY